VDTYHVDTFTFTRDTRRTIQLERQHNRDNGIATTR